MDSPNSCKQHDVGGHEDLFTELDLSDKPLAIWEKRVHALLGTLVKKQIIYLDELRRSTEQINAEAYANWSYYAKWALSLTQLALEKGKLTRQDVVATDEQVTEEYLFQPGDFVRVKEEDLLTRWAKPHVRVPGYLFGSIGKIESLGGKFGDPEVLGWGFPAKLQPCYRIQFFHIDIWHDYEGPQDDFIEVEVFQSWLQSSSEELFNTQHEKASMFPSQKRN